MITNRPYLLMRTWTPNSAPVDSSTFDSLKHNRGQLSTMILWYPRLQDAFPTKSGLPHWWPQTPCVQLAPLRSSTQIKKGRIQHSLIKIKSGFTIQLKPRISTALHIAVPHYSTPSLFLWPPPLFPQNLFFSPSSTLVKLQIFPNFHFWSYLVLFVLKLLTQVNCL